MPDHPYFRFFLHIKPYNTTYIQQNKFKPTTLMKTNAYWLWLPPTWQHPALPACTFVERIAASPVFAIQAGWCPNWRSQLCGICSLLCTVSQDVERFIVFLFAGLLPYEWPCFHRPDTGLAIKLVAYTHTHKHLCYSWVSLHEHTKQLNIYAWTLWQSN